MKRILGVIAIAVLVGGVSVFMLPPRHEFLEKSSNQIGVYELIRNEETALTDKIHADVVTVRSDRSLPEAATLPSELLDPGEQILLIQNSASLGYPGWERVREYRHSGNGYVFANAMMAAQEIGQKSTHEQKLRIVEDLLDSLERQKQNAGPGYFGNLLLIYESLAVMKTEECIDVLSYELLNGPDDLILQGAVVSALGEIGSKKALPALHAYADILALKEPEAGMSIGLSETKKLVQQIVARLSL